VFEFRFAAKIHSSVALLVLTCLLFAPSSKTFATELRSPAYLQAEQSFGLLPLDDRVRLQILLTAAGYWQAVPNADFSTRLFDAIARYQVENGFLATGELDTQQMQRLVSLGGTMLDQWGFQKIRHPTQDVAIWVPLGLNLNAQLTQYGVKYDDPLGRLTLTFDYFPSFNVHTSFDALINDLASKGFKIFYSKVYRDDFFVVSASNDVIDEYVRYHATWDGGVGFSLYWNHSAVDLHAERIATLISGSLWSAMSGAPTTEPFKVDASNHLVASLASPPAFANPAPPQVSAPVNAPQPSTAPASPPPETKKGPSSGTGFYIDHEGLILTNSHVVQDCSGIEVGTEKGEFVSASLVARDIVNDLAVIRVAYTGSKVAQLRPNVRLGENVEAFGYPFNGLLATSGNFTLGNISALSGLRDDSRYIQISAPIQPGNSGGPLLDQSGNVVGIVSAKLDALKVMIATNGDIPENVNFATKASTAATFLASKSIKFETGVATQQLQSADIADQAKAMSVIIVCR
jgi:serine protease Do